MDSKIRIKMGALEVEYEGSEQFINDKLIGGFTLQVGDRRIDASFARQIRQLAMGFSENPYVKEY